jgi:hypothetical protein
MVIIRQKKFSSTSDELASVSPGIALAGTGLALLGHAMNKENKIQD